MNTIKFAAAACAASVIGVLAFANGGDIVIRFWPDMTDYGLPASPEVVMPVFAVGIICLFAGFLLGALREYLREGRIRGQARRAKGEAAKLRKRVDELTADEDDDIPALAAR